MLKDYVVFDLETTGLSPEKDTMIEIGALKVIQGKVADRFSEFINPHQKLTEQISELTGITDEMLAGARDLQAVVSDFVDFCEDYVVVGHNLGFDYRSLSHNMVYQIFLLLHIPEQLSIHLDKYINMVHF